MQSHRLIERTRKTAKRTAMNVRAADSLRAFSADAWNRVAVDQPGARYELVQAIDTNQAEERLVRYYAVDGGGAYRAIARVVAGPSATRSILGIVYGRAARLLAISRWRQDALVCGWSLQSRSVLADPQLSQSDGAALVHEICAAIEADADGMPVIFPEVLEDDDCLSRVLVERGYVMAAARPVAVLDVNWRSLDEYIETLKRASKGWASAVRNEINRFRKSGAVVEPLSARDEDYARVCELLNAHYERLNGRSPRYLPQMLRAMHTELGDDLVARVSRAARGGAITGACIGVRSGSDAAIKWIGIDHRSSGANFTYFNLGYYAMVQELSELGARRIWFGNAAYDAKIKRGCRLVECRVFVRAGASLQRALDRGLFAVQRLWMRRKYARYLTARRT